MKIDSVHDALLFTPGPLTTSLEVKLAGLHDLGSRDARWIEKTQNLRRLLVEQVAHGSWAEFTTVLFPGSGTYAVEAVLTTPPRGQEKTLVLANGAYGQRMIEILKVAQIPFLACVEPENRLPQLSEVEIALQKDPTIQRVAMVHCETTSGILNPIEEVGQIAKKYRKTFIVDAMSSLGGIPIDLQACSVDYLISSSNKCLQGVPGLSFVIARREQILQTEAGARSLSLDLYSQWLAQETKGEFRFTPPIQVLLSFEAAIQEFLNEGGVKARHQRYTALHQQVLTGMKKMGFKPYLNSELMAPVITTFFYLQDPRFEYNTFYQKLSDRGWVIYSGKVSDQQCFRIGNIGQIDEQAVHQLLLNMRDVLAEMGVQA